MKIFISLLFVLSCTYAIAQTNLSVTVSDKATKKGIPAAKVKIMNGKTVVQQGTCDETGTYKVENIQSATFTINCEAKNYHSETKKNVFVAAGKNSFVTVYLKKK